MVNDCGGEWMIVMWMFVMVNDCDGEWMKEWWWMTMLYDGVSSDGVSGWSMNEIPTASK